MLPWKPEFKSSQPIYQMQPFPMRNEAKNEIWPWLANQL